MFAVTVLFDVVRLVVGLLSIVRSGIENIVTGIVVHDRSLKNRCATWYHNGYERNRKQCCFVEAYWETRS